MISFYGNGGQAYVPYNPVGGDLKGAINYRRKNDLIPVAGNLVGSIPGLLPGNPKYNVWSLPIVSRPVGHSWAKNYAPIYGTNGKILDTGKVRIDYPRSSE